MFLIFIYHEVIDMCTLDLMKKFGAGIFVTSSELIFLQCDRFPNFEIS